MYRVAENKTIFEEVILNVMSIEMNLADRVNKQQSRQSAGEGVGRSQFQRGDRHCGSQGILYMYFVKQASDGPLF